MNTYQHEYKRVLGENHVECVWIEQFVPAMRRTEVHSSEWGKCPVIGWVWRKHQEFKDGHSVRFWETIDGVAVSSMNTFVVEDESADYLIEDA